VANMLFGTPGNRGGINVQVHGSGTGSAQQQRQARQAPHKEIRDDDVIDV